MPSIALAHATGFCGSVWRPVIEELPTDLATCTWDFPNHGGAPKVAKPVDWWLFGAWARDQVSQVERPIIGVGHSMGGAALVMAELLSPGTFAGLVLIEPMLFPPPYARADNHLSHAVLKRQRHFSSRQAARDNFASKQPFGGWVPSALDGYLDCGLVDAAETGVALACAPEDEADIYRGATAHGAWDRLAEVQAPVLVLVGAQSEPFPEQHARAVAERFPRAGIEFVSGTSHFLPMEQPATVARRIELMAAGLVNRSHR